MSSIASSASAPAVSISSGRGRYAKIGLATVVAAVLANTLFYYLASLVVNYDLDFVVLTNPSGAIIFTFVPAVGAVLLYGALRRFTANPVRIFHIIAAVFFVVTLVPDFTYIPGVEGASNGQTSVLVLMHVIAYAVIAGMLTTLAHPNKR